MDDDGFEEQVEMLTSELKDVTEALWEMMSMVERMQKKVDNLEAIVARIPPSVLLEPHER